jgi:hypothetical protein
MLEWSKLAGEPPPRDLRSAGRNFPTPIPMIGERPPHEEQVGAPVEQSTGDYNRNREQTHLSGASSPCGGSPGVARGETVG